MQLKRKVGSVESNKGIEAMSVHVGCAETGSAGTTVRLSESERKSARTVRIRELQDELKRLLEEEANEVCSNLEELKAECANMARDGRKVEAVKLYRNRTGLTLVEALDVIDGLMSED